MTLESFLEGHVRVVDWLGGVPRECVYDNLRSVVAKRDSREMVRWNPRFFTSSQSSTKYSRIMSGSTPTVSSSRSGSQGAGSDTPHPRRTISARLAKVGGPPGRASSPNAPLGGYRSARRLPDDDGATFITCILAAWGTSYFNV